MAIVISGVNNNDKITASDGTIDLLSGVNFNSELTVPSFKVGSNIQIGNAGIITATTLVGNVTGNINHTSNLLLQIGGSEKFRVASSGQLGIGGANYGSSGQVLTSGGSGSAATWSAIPAQATIANNADNRVITGGSGVNLNGESNLQFDGTGLSLGTGTPRQKLHIHASDSGASNMVFTNATTGNSAGDGFVIGITGGEVAQLNMQESADLKFSTADTERLRITSTGVHKISQAANTQDGTFYSTVTISSPNGVWQGLRFDRGTTAKWRIGMKNDDTFQIANLFLNGSPGADDNTLRITDNNNISITGNLAFASGKGIDFSATANGSGTMENELLSDYEEGTWVPVYNNVNTPTYGHRSGRYTKIGRFVYLVCQISVDSGLDTSDGSTVNIGGFPFTGNSAHGSCLFTLGQYIDVMPDSTIDLFTNVRFLGNAVLLHEGRNNQDITYTQLNSSGNLQFACSYAL